MNDAEFKTILKSLAPADFDGHTEFSRLSVKQKLAWLSEAARFCWKTREGCTGLSRGAAETLGRLFDPSAGNEAS
jgi:hypothetical protein